MVNSVVAVVTYANLIPASDVPLPELVNSLFLIIRYAFEFMTSLG
ncbi:unnamed protein product, partial [marine sediment metagenome]